MAAVAACVALLAGGAQAAGADPQDPMEAFNRSVDGVNRSLDEAALKPVARAYERVMPSPVRKGVSNFFGNLGDAWSAANSVLQLKPTDAAQNGMRFAMNTVFGLAGIVDLATEAGIERRKQDFGTTLARWGVPAGPYVVLPLLGPSTLRDAVALPLDFAGHPLAQVTPVATRNAFGAVGVVDTRGRLLPLDAAADQALDGYMFRRDVYLQHRQAQVQGEAGAPDEAGMGAIDPAEAPLEIGKSTTEGQEQ